MKELATARPLDKLGINFAQRTGGSQAKLAEPDMFFEAIAKRCEVERPG
jgi:hypothetical protein